MSPKLRNVKIRTLVRALEKDGFELKRKSGSHKTYKHPERGTRITVSYHHSGETATPGLLQEVIKAAGWTEADLVRLRLMRKG